MSYIDVKPNELFDCDLLSVGFTYKKYLKGVLIPHGLIRDRTTRIAENIADKIKSLNIKSIILLCVLKGASPFFNDLCKDLSSIINMENMNINVNLEFIRVKSYVGEKSQDLTIVGLANEDDLKNKHVVIVEDIVDTGKTMVKLLEHLSSIKLKSVHVASLLLKQTTRSNGYIPDFVGFRIPDDFVVGYGLDYNEFFRSMLHIGVISDDGLIELKKSLLAMNEEEEERICKKSI